MRCFHYYRDTFGSETCLFMWLSGFLVDICRADHMTTAASVWAGQRSKIVLFTCRPCRSGIFTENGLVLWAESLLCYVAYIFYHIWSYLITPHYQGNWSQRNLAKRFKSPHLQPSKGPLVATRCDPMRLLWGAHVGMYTELATMYAKCAADLRFIQVSCWEDNTKIQGPKQLRTQDKSLKVQVQVRVSWPRMAHPQSLQVQAKDADGLHQDERAEVEHPKAHPCMREATSSWHSNHMFWMSLDIIYI